MASAFPSFLLSSGASLAILPELAYPKTTFIVLSLFSYLLLVRSLRWRRYDALHRKYQAKFEAGKLTADDAQEVMNMSVQYDMPTLLNYSLGFALFKTYAIPTISKLLFATKELGSSAYVARRYADTEILISTFVGCPISGKALHGENDKSLVQEEKKSDSKEFENGVKPVEDPRALIALARVNWLHAKYPIKNDDYLYTLGLFIFEPQAWAERFGWRALSPLEKQAYFMHWCELGRRMDIKDIPATQKAFKEWIASYEAECMVPAQTNHEVAAYTIDELVHGVPEAFGLKSFMSRLVVCALEEKVRIAMIQPSQPTFLYIVLHSVLYINAFIHQYLCLPRSDALFPIETKLPSPTPASLSEGRQLPRMHPTHFQSTPWYKPVSETLFGRFLDWLAVKAGFYTSFPGEELISQGYRIEEMGPIKYEKSGQEEVIRMASQLSGGCPIRL